MLRLFTQDGGYNETLDLLHFGGPMLNLDANMITLDSLCAFFAACESRTRTLRNVAMHAELELHWNE